MAGGAKVTVYDAKLSVGRKFLVAGRGGLNLTHTEAKEPFVSRYSGGKNAGALWNSLLDDFNSEALRDWAKELGVETFVATTGRVYPKEMKAAPLLRRWVQRLRATGVEFAMGHRWTGLKTGARWQVEFLVGGDKKICEADAVVMALGGGTWPETGSDGGWVWVFEKMGIAVAPLVASNCGWEVGWAGAVLAQAEGKPLKNITIRFYIIDLEYKCLLESATSLTTSRKHESRVPPTMTRSPGNSQDHLPQGACPGPGPEDCETAYPPQRGSPRPGL